ncbi:hypothetical protein [Sandaracinus amylolyticus]|uniref:hypothetical protein n=1 Tax=Sandaracinus amylolyticus TaxID=927083 RepID=UPI001F39C3EC|nr:hypothetical protein [Sandaracinus amylolyticus]
MPLAIRLGRVERALRAADLPDDADARRRAIVSATREAFAVVSVAVRVMHARMLSTRLDAPPASIASRVVWGLAYLALLASTSASAFMLFLLQPQPGAAWIACGDPLPRHVETARSVVLTPYGADRQPLPPSPGVIVYEIAGDDVCAPEPWGPSPIAEERAARYARVIRAQDAIERRIGAFPEEDEGALDVWYARTASELRSQFAEAPLDAEMVEAYLALRDPRDEAADAAARERLAALLGVPSECPRARYRPRIASYADETGVERFDVVVHRDSPSTTRGVVEWLCARGASGVYAFPHE